MKIFLVLFLSCFELMTRLHAQVSVNTDGSAPAPTAMLDIKSTGKGVLIPRMSTVNRTSIMSPATGLLVYDVDVKSFWFYDGTGWKEIRKGNIPELADADNNTKVQVEASPNEDKIRFITAGTQQLFLDGKTAHLASPGNSLFLGLDAGLIDDGTNNNNVFIGPNTGKDNVIGSSNLFVGVSAGRHNTANSNTFLGINAGIQNTSGRENTFVGEGAGFQNTTGTENTFVGEGVGFNNSTAGKNTFLGWTTGENNSTGAENTFLGHNAGGMNTTGMGNTLIGKNTNVNTNALTNATALGADTRVDCSNCMVLGSVNGINGATATTSIGIGTTVPNNAAIVDIQSTNKGLLLPRMTSSQRTAIIAPGAGLLVYDLNAKTIFMHDGTQWQPFAMMSSNIQGSVLSSQPTAIFNDGEFGYAVAIDGEDVIVGAPQNEASANPGILNAGTATIYAESGGWSEITTLTYPSPMNDDHFGWSVDINGSYAIIGAPDDDGINTNQGGARIFFFNGTTWAFQSQLNEAGTNFHYGQSVSLIHENTAAIGIPGFTGNGKVDIYTRTGTIWSQTFEIMNTGTNNTGSHVVLSGNKICVGAFAANTGIGKFYIYYYNGTTWLQEYESPSATAYSLAFQGNYVALGSGSDVSVYWFNGTTWALQASLVSNDFISGDDFGHSVSIDGDYILAGAPRNDINANTNQGSVYMFRRNGSSWIQVGNITDSAGVAEALFGQSVDISDHQYVIGSQKGNNTKGAVSFGTLY